MGYIVPETQQMWLCLAILSASADHQTGWLRMLSNTSDIQLTAGHAVVYLQGLQHKLVTVHHRCWCEYMHAYKPTSTVLCNTAWAWMSMPALQCACLSLSTIWEGCVLYIWGVYDTTGVYIKHQGCV